MPEHPSLPRHRFLPGEGSEARPPEVGYPAGFAGRFRANDLEPAELSLLDLVRLFRRHWMLILSVAAIGGAIGAYKALSTTPSYRANAVIRLHDSQRALIGVADESRPNLGGRADAYTSLLEVMRSEAVLGDIVDRSPIRLREANTGAPPTYLDEVEIAHDAQRDTLRFRFSEAEFTVVHSNGETTAAYGVPVELPELRFIVITRPDRPSSVLVLQSRDGALRSIRTGLSTVQRERTDLVDVRYASGNPVLAQMVVNEVVEAFQRNSVRMSQQQSRMRRIFLEEQLRQAREAQEEAQLALSGFRSREQVYSSGSRTSEQQGLQSISARREELVTQRQFYASILAELERSRFQTGQGINTLVAYPGIMSNPVVSALLQQWIRHESAREELITGEAGVRADHPDVQRLDGLIASTQDRLLSAVRSQLEVMDSQISNLARQQERTSQQLRQLPDVEAEEVRLVQRADAAGRLTLSLEGELQKARIAEAVEVGQVEILERAGRAGASGGGNLSLSLLLGVVAGLLLGGGSAFVVEKVNTSIRSEDELRRVLSVPGLAVIPRISANGAHGLRSWVRLGLPRFRGISPAGNTQVAMNGSTLLSQGRSEVAIHAVSAGAEAYRALRTNLIFSPGVRSLKTAVVTSAVPREGKTTTAANLAVAFAQHGMSVLLIDADLRRPRQHEVFKVPQSPGLTDTLFDHVLPADAIHRTPVAGLSILTAGTLSPNPAELLGGRRMQQLLATIGEQFDLILLDTPPLLSVADAAILAVSTDGAIFVVHAGRTDREAVQAGVHKLNAVGARVIGAVLNDPDAHVPRYSRYHSYTYNYSSVG